MNSSLLAVKCARWNVPRNTKEVDNIRSGQRSLFSSHKEYLGICSGIVYYEESSDLRTIEDVRR